MIKVMVVDDSVFMRKMITKMLEKEKDIEIVAIAKNGKEAVELNLKHSPDVITLDIEMPVMNGLEALKEIMKTKECLNRRKCQSAYWELQRQR